MRQRAEQQRRHQPSRLGHPRAVAVPQALNSGGYVTQSQQEASSKTEHQEGMDMPVGYLCRRFDNAILADTKYEI